MKILHRYLLNHFIGPFIFCLLSFIFVYIAIDLFNNLNEMVESRLDIITVFYYYLNLIPFIFVQTAPIAVLVAIMYSLGIFNRNNEILAMRSSGISLLDILTPLIMMGLLISVAAFLVNDRVVPTSSMTSARIKDEKMEKVKNTKKLKKKVEIELENIAFHGKKNRIIYARRYFVFQKKIVGLIIFNQDKEQSVTSKITASEASWQNDKWYGRTVVSFNLDKTGRIVGDPDFYEEAYIDIEEDPADFRQRQNQTEFMSSAELKKCIGYLSFVGGTTVRNLKVDLHQKFALPFANLIVILVASPFAFRTNRRGGVIMGICISIAMVLGYYVIMSVSLAFGKAGFIPPFLSAWCPNIIFAAAGLILILRDK
ncbi:MAG: LptF/LptG family permease [Candidatus Omnitrophica bacterium]|nr:LptF/LptG family permease [Candidatus Omnitrophota bacterium]MBU4488664.1 LptF/LptG family permease [Candidatus Omnitrophota bacterium]MCG2704788.1 LptF/LptG family permease [Candidatus Omnitrophota bacterium]